MAAGLPLPQFQAQRPEAVGSNVVQMAPRINSFWGQTIPSLMNAASGIRTMIEGDPNVKLREDAQRSADQQALYSQANAAPTDEAAQAMWQARWNEAEAKGDEVAMKALEATRGKMGTFRSTKEKAGEESFNTVKGLKKAGEVSGDAGTFAPAQPGVTPPGAPVPEVGVVEGMNVPTTGEPGAANPTAELMGGKLPTSPQVFPSETGNTISDQGQPPPQNPGQGPTLEQLNSQPHTETGAPAWYSREDHPLVQQAAQQTGIAPQNLNINKYGQVVPSVEAVIAGQAPVSAAFPLPPQNSTNPQTLQAAERGGAEGAMTAAAYMRNVSYARAMGDISAGRTPTSGDLIGMHLSDSQAQMAIQDSMLKHLGVVPPGVNLQNALLYAQVLRQDPSTVKFLQQHPEVMSQFQRNWASLGAEAQGALLGVSSTFLKQMSDTATLQEKAAAHAWTIKSQLMGHVITATKDGLRFNARTGLFEVDPNSLHTQKAQADLEHTRASTANFAAEQKFRQTTEKYKKMEIDSLGNKQLADEQKRMSASINGNIPKPPTYDKAMTALAHLTPVMREADLESHRLDNEIQSRRKIIAGIDESTLKSLSTDPRMSKNITVTNPDGSVTIKKVTFADIDPAKMNAEIEELQGKKKAWEGVVEQHRTDFDNAQKQVDAALARDTSGMPLPNNFVDRVIYDPRNVREGKVAKAPSPEFQQLLAGMYHSPDEGVDKYYALSRRGLTSKRVPVTRGDYFAKVLNPMKLNLSVPEADAAYDAYRTYFLRKKK